MTASSVDEVLDLFESWGGQHYDEDVAQLDHALQTAAQAEASCAGDALVAAALLHDVGHLLELRDQQLPGEVRRHEDLGAVWLRRLFPPAVTAPIALHVRAKRYLCAVEPSYADRLSRGSITSLGLQGGAMSSQEVEVFRTSARYEDAVRLRRWDDAAKVPGLAVAPLSERVRLLRRVATPPKRQGAPSVEA